MNQEADMEALRLAVKARGEINNALHDIAKWCFDLTLTCMTTDGVSDDIRRRARAAHATLLKYRREYDLRSRAEVERGQWDLAIDSPNYEGFAQQQSEFPSWIWWSTLVCGVLVIGIAIGGWML